MLKTWILIDLLYLAHRARFSMRGFSADETPTGILFGFFEQLLHVCSLPMLRKQSGCGFRGLKRILADQGLSRLQTEAGNQPH